MTEEYMIEYMILPDEAYKMCGECHTYYQNAMRISGDAREQFEDQLSVTTQEALALASARSMFATYLQFSLQANHYALRALDQVGKSDEVLFAHIPALEEAREKCRTCNKEKPLMQQTLEQIFQDPRVTKR